jgi:hypothetical protein
MFFPYRFLKHRTRSLVKLSDECKRLRYSAIAEIIISNFWLYIQIGYRWYSVSSHAGYSQWNERAC